MTYALPLRLRERLARNKRDLYWSDPAYRLECINRRRIRDGKEPIADLAEVETRGPRYAAA